MATGTHHLLPTFSEPLSNDLKGVDTALRWALHCVKCKGNLLVVENRLDSIENLVGRVLSITTAILEQMGNGRDVALCNDPGVYGFEEKTVETISSNNLKPV